MECHLLRINPSLLPRLYLHGARVGGYFSKFMVDSVPAEGANVHGRAFLGELLVPIGLRRKRQEPILHQREQELVKPTDNNKIQKLSFFVFCFYLQITESWIWVTQSYKLELKDRTLLPLHWGCWGEVWALGTNFILEMNLIYNLFISQPLISSPQNFQQ